jgi:hypothetical protein
MRSFVSGSVVYRSWWKPWNSDPVVFMTTRSSTPDTTVVAVPS